MLGNPCSTGRPSPTGILHLLMSLSALAVLFLPVGTTSLIKLLVQSCAWLSFLHPLLQFSWALFTGYAGTSLSRGVPLRRCRHYVPSTHTHTVVLWVLEGILRTVMFSSPWWCLGPTILSLVPIIVGFRIAVGRLLWEALCFGFQSVSKRCMSWYEIATSTLSALSFYPLDSWNSLRKKLVQQLNPPTPADARGSA